MPWKYQQGLRQMSDMTLSKECKVDYSIIVPVYFNEGLLKGTFAMVETRFEPATFRSPDKLPNQ